MMSSTTHSEWWRPALAGAALAGVFLCARPAAAAAPVYVPQAWLAGHGLPAADAPAANGMEAWQCFVAGLDPADAAARLGIRININTEKGGRFLSWTPDLTTGRVYTVEAKTNLADSGWVPLAGGGPQSLAEAEKAGLRFFRVKVGMPEGWPTSDAEVYSVTVDAAGGAGVSGAGEYPAGAPVTVNAGAKEGHSFRGWLPAGISLDNAASNPVSFTMPPNNVSLKVAWTVNSYNVAVAGGGEGASGAGEYAYGSSVTVAAGTKPDCFFSRWTAEGVELADPSANPLSFTMPAGDVALEAAWMPNPTVSVAGGGEGASGAGKYPAGASVTVAAGTRAGCSFSRWTAEGVELVDPSANLVSFTMPPNDVALEAAWITNYNVSIAGGGEGASGAGAYPAGASVTAAAGTKPGRIFAGWLPTGISLTNATANPVSFTMPSNDVALEAWWEESGVVVVNGGGEGASGAGEYAYGSSVTVDAGTKPGYVFAGWEADGVSLDNAATNPVSFTMPRCAVTLTASWEENAPQLYMVVDLSQGANASSNGPSPVSYLSCVPDGGWTDEYRTNKLVLRKIYPGTFRMGGRGSDDETLHQVTLTQPFYMGVFELTQKQWELVMGGKPAKYPGDARPVEQVSYDDIRGASAGAEWPGSAGVDAGSFMGKIREKTGLDGFDLPTEAQWEYACRAGTKGDYNVDGEQLAALGRYKDNKSDGKGGYSEHTAVGSYLPNAWGLYDMHGNVYEWCLDWYGLYGGGEAAEDPDGAESGSWRVLRGGSWSDTSGASHCRSSYRNYDPSNSQKKDYGFRPVCSVGPQPPPPAE